MRFTWSIAISTVFLGSGCATTSYDVSNMQKNFSEAMQSSESIVQKAQTDYREKSVLVDNLRKGAASEFKASEADISRRLKTMESLMEKIIDSRKQMVKANADIASLGYKRTKVNSGELEYERLDQAAQNFQESARELNRSAVAYSLESNSLADLVTQKQLFLTFEVAEFETRLRETIRTSQENLKGMEKALSQADALANSVQGAHPTDAAGMAKEMEALAQKYSTIAQKFAPLGKDIRDLTAPAPRLSSLDPNWPLVKKVVAEFDSSARELSRINDDFLKKWESLRALIRAAR